MIGILLRILYSGNSIVKKSQFFKKQYLFFVIVFLLFLIITEGVGQSLSINGGNRELRITDGIPDGQLIDVTNTNCSLRYTTPFSWPPRNWKITVRTTCPDQSFGLRVIAVSPQRGTAAPEVTLSTGNPAADFVTNITWANNSRCTLRYTAFATFAQGHSGDVDNDRHTITYTLQQQ